MSARRARWAVPVGALAALACAREPPSPRACDVHATAPSAARRDAATAPTPGAPRREAATAPAPRRCPAWSEQLVVQPDPRRDPGVRVAVHVPEGFRADGQWALVLHLHGSGDCGARAAWCGPMPRGTCPLRAQEAFGDCSAALLDAAGFNAVVAVPQLHRGSDPRFPMPHLGDHAYAARFLQALAAQVPSCGEGSAPVSQPPAVLAVTAHSLGARSLEPLLDNASLRPAVSFAAVLDGVVGPAGTYLRWLGRAPEGARRLVVVPAGVASTRALASALERDAPARGFSVGVDLPFEPGAPDPALRVVHSAWAHGLVPVMYFHKVLRAAPLPLREPGASPPWLTLRRPAPRVATIDALPADLEASLDPSDGAFADNSPFDEYRVAVPPGRTLVVRASAPGAFDSLDPALVLLEGEGIAWCDDATPRSRDRGAARAALARWRAPASGRVVFRVRTTATGWPRGAYRLRAELAPP